MPAAPTWSAAPSITHTGTGPAVSCALANGAAGTFDDHTIVITIAVGGANGAAQASVAYDGTTAIETIAIPVEPSPTLLGTVDLTGLTLSTLNATTLAFTAPAALTVTFTTPTSVEDIAAQVNAQAIAGGKVHRAEIVQSSTGTKKLRLYTTTGGAGVTLTIDATTSTGEAILGFTSGASNLTATGTAATATLPFTGLTFTFPSGTYVKGDVYTAVCTGPRASISALVAAATAARNDFTNHPFGFIAVAQPSDGATNCAALESALSTLTAAWLADTTSPAFVTHVVGAPFHVVSSTVTTNDANIAAADAALLAAFNGAAANLDNVAVADIYIPGAPSLRSGTFRRTAALAWAVKRATAPKLAADVGEGLVAEGTLLAPDLATRARDEARATTKLGRGDGPGFSALKSTSAGLAAVKFAPGATRAGSSSRLRYAGVVGVALEIARLIFAEVEPWDALTLPTDPQTGRLEDGEKATREGHLTEILRATLRPDGGIANVSSYRVVVDNANRFIDDGRVAVKVTFVPLGEVEDVTVDITALGTAIAA
jgi:hypothetical protein